MNNNIKGLLAASMIVASGCGGASQQVLQSISEAPLTKGTLIASYSLTAAIESTGQTHDDENEVQEDVDIEIPTTIDCTQGSGATDGIVVLSINTIVCKYRTGLNSVPSNPGNGRYHLQYGQSHPDCSKVIRVLKHDSLKLSFDSNYTQPFLVVVFLNLIGRR